MAPFDSKIHACIHYFGEYLASKRLNLIDRVIQINHFLGASVLLSSFFAGEAASLAPPAFSSALGSPALRKSALAFSFAAIYSFAFSSAFASAMPAALPAADDVALSLILSSAS